MARNVLKADGLLLLTALIWGTTFVAQRVGMESIGPMLYNGLRFALGALCVLPLALRGSGASAHTIGAGHALLGGCAAGVVLFCGASLQQIGLVYTTAGKAGFITGLYVILVPILGLFLHQRAGWEVWAGALAACAGMYLLSVTEQFTIGYGDALELGGAAFWAIHVLLVGWLASRIHAVRLACIQFTACAILSLLVAVATEPLVWSAVREATIPILYGGVLSVGVGYTLQVVAQRDAVPAHAAIILSMEAVFAVLAGGLVLGETLSVRQGLGCALMLAGMLLVQLLPLLRRRRRYRRVAFLKHRAEES